MLYRLLCCCFMCFCMLFVGLLKAACRLLYDCLLVLYVFDMMVITTYMCLFVFIVLNRFSWVVYIHRFLILDIWLRVRARDLQIQYATNQIPGSNSPDLTFYLADPRSNKNPRLQIPGSNILTQWTWEIPRLQIPRSNILTPDARSPVWEMVLVISGYAEYTLLVR